MWVDWEAVDHEAAEQIGQDYVDGHIDREQAIEAWVRLGWSEEAARTLADRSLHS